MFSSTCTTMRAAARLDFKPFYIMDMFFRVRRYVRQLTSLAGETDLSLFQVQYENGQYNILWYYENYEKPTFQQLSEISAADIEDEKSKFYAELLLYTSDIYTYNITVDEKQITDAGDQPVVREVPITVVRANTPSRRPRRIQLTNLGYYRVTISGASKGNIEIVVNQRYTGRRGEVAIYKSISSDENHSFVALVESRGTADFLHMKISTRAPCKLQGNILVEYLT